MGSWEDENVTIQYHSISYSHKVSSAHVQMNNGTIISREKLVVPKVWTCVSTLAVFFSGPLGEGGGGGGGGGGEYPLYVLLVLITGHHISHVLLVLIQGHTLHMFLLVLITGAYLLHMFLLVLITGTYPPHIIHTNL